MIRKTSDTLADLYEADETAWLKILEFFLTLAAGSLDSTYGSSVRNSY